MTNAEFIYILAIVLFGIILTILGPPGWVIGLLIVGGFFLMVWGVKRSGKDNNEKK